MTYQSSAPDEQAGVASPYFETADDAIVVQTSLSSDFRRAAPLYVNSKDRRTGDHHMIVPPKQLIERYEQRERVPLNFSEHDLGDFMDHAKQLLIEENVVSGSDEEFQEQAEFTPEPRAHL